MRNCSQIYTLGVADLVTAKTVRRYEFTSPWKKLTSSMPGTHSRIQMSTALEFAYKLQLASIQTLTLDQIGGSLSRLH